MKLSGGALHKPPCPARHSRTRRNPSREPAPGLLQAGNTPGFSTPNGQVRKPPAIELAHLVFRYRGSPDESARHEIGWKPLLAVDMELNFVRPAPRHDDRPDLFDTELIDKSEGTGLVDARERRENAFDQLRLDLVATDVQHGLLPAGYDQQLARGQRAD